MGEAHTTDVASGNSKDIKKKITGMGVAVAIVSVIVLSMFFVYIKKSQTQYIEYTEKSDLDYNVYLNDNNFYDGEFLPADNQYISELIKSIKAKFNYDLSVEDRDIEYQYNYKVVANVSIKEDGQSKNIYTFTEDLVKDVTSKSDASSKVTISQDVDIDYNKYNDLVKKFISSYELEDVQSILTVDMYVDVFGVCEDVEDASKQSVISLSMPLAEKTVSIDMKYDLEDESVVKLMTCKATSCETIFIIVLFVFIAIDAVLAIVLYKFIVKNRTAKVAYKKQLNKILRNYKSYIQEVSFGLEPEEFTLVGVKGFTELLEISDRMNAPILMVESKEKEEVHFMVPSGTLENNKYLYSYRLSVEE